MATRPRTHEPLEWTLERQQLQREIRSLRRQVKQTRASRAAWKLRAQGAEWALRRKLSPGLSTVSPDSVDRRPW